MLRRGGLGKRAKRRLFDITAVQYRYPVLTGADFGQVDFSVTPTTIATVKAHKQLASAEALTNANLEVKEGQWQVWTEPLTLSPSTDRLLIDSVEYEVLRVLWNDSSHSHLIVEQR